MNDGISSWLRRVAVTLDEDASHNLTTAVSSAVAANTLRASISLGLIAAVVAFMTVPGSIQLPNGSCILILAGLSVVLTYIQFEWEAKRAGRLAKKLHDISEALKEDLEKNSLPFALNRTSELSEVFNDPTVVAIDWFSIVLTTIALILFFVNIL